jgi:3'-5' exonuclease
MRILTVDFETYYDRDYSLSKITTEEYVRSNLFETIGVAVKVDDEETRWVSGTDDEIREFLSQFEWGKSVALAHNAAFDMAILSWRYGIRPKLIADTLSMARAIHGTEVGGSLATLSQHYGLGEKGTEVVNALGKRRKDFYPEDLARYGQYCINDVNLTYRLFECLAGSFPISELQLIDLTVRMFTEPTLYLDKPMLEAHLASVKLSKDKLMQSIESVSRDTLMSNPQFAELLRKYGVEPPMKISTLTGRETYAFSKADEAFKALLEHENPTVQALVAARLGVKSTLEETRTQRFIEIQERGPLPVPLTYFAAHTGRWGGCLVADTEVMVYNTQNGVEVKRIVDVLLDDLVWDGEAFVPHEGVVFSGFSEVIEWDGVKGTADHVVFTDAGEVSLRDAMQGQHKIKVGGTPSQDAVDSARSFMENHKRKN